MASGFGDSASRPSQSQGPSFSSSNANNGDAGNFECNICFDLAQDPIVTLCGHLFCWPCLYKWLHIHSHSQECPVCKAVVKEESLVPLYGRGKTSTDPRSRSIPGVNIPNRPAGQRPETAPPPEQNHFAQRGFGFMGGLGGFAPPIATTTRYSAAFISLSHTHAHRACSFLQHRSWHQLSPHNAVVRRHGICCSSICLASINQMH
ncbi:E3 ubiquitin-protein ligase RNF185 isoform X3 [Rosa chinensis]|uniref:E3 ubiquitin-protein ligase RNF185 isoform X3 n=1 Tax=Rosa chinensis TaxID=74649 RepID=UPI001AD8F4DF|nr:E3 ubiquitin-protein ligase RNF185 isoform X3 [Rosa chinensis]